MWPDRVHAFLLGHNHDNDADWQKTEALKVNIADFRTNHPGEGLARPLFNQIVSWKLRGQIHRNEHNLENINDSLVKEITGAAFRVVHQDNEILSRVRAEILQTIPGVGIGVASAILTMYYPESFGIIDFRTWDEINEQDPTQPPKARTFTINQYMTYLSTIRSVAEEEHVSVQLIDYALWRTWELRRE